MSAALSIPPLTELAAWKNSHLSVSRLRKYEECPNSFRLGYVHKGEKMPRGDAAAFGVVLHSALEVMFAWIKSEEFEGPFPEHLLLDFYRQAWRDSGSIVGGAPLAGVEMYQEGLEMLRSFAKRHGPVDHWSILAVEHEFNEVIEGFLFNGYIDRVDRLSDTKIHITDYKSSRKLYTREDLETDFQMSIYGIVAKRLWPWATEIEFSFSMLRFSLEQKATRTPEQLVEAGRYAALLGQQTESDTAWEARLNANCGYCDHRGRCDAYAKALAGDWALTKVRDLETLDALATERARVSRLSKMLYARQRELDDILKAKIETEGPFEAGGYSHRLLPMFSKSYPREATIGALVRAGVAREEAEARVLEVDRGAVDALVTEIVERDPLKGHLLRAEIEVAEVSTPKSDRIDVRKLK